MSASYYWKKVSGKEYLFRLFPYYNRWQVTMHDMDKSLTWQGNFDQCASDKMTTKTGKHIPFDVFFSMLANGFQIHRGAVKLSVMTFKSLKELFQEALSPDTPNQAEEEQKRYLIATVKEPEPTHYPLVLKSIEIPDPEMVFMAKQQMNTCKQDCSVASSLPNVSMEKIPTQQPEDKPLLFAGDLSPQHQLSTANAVENITEKAEAKEQSGREQGFTDRSNRSTHLKSADEFMKKELLLKKEVAKLREDNERLRLKLDKMTVHEMELSAELLVHKRKLFRQSDQYLNRPNRQDSLGSNDSEDQLSGHLRSRTPLRRHCTSMMDMFDDQPPARAPPQRYRFKTNRRGADFSSQQQLPHRSASLDEVVRRRPRRNGPTAALSRARTQSPIIDRFGPGGRMFGTSQRNPRIQSPADRPTGRTFSGAPPRRPWTRSDSQPPAVMPPAQLAAARGRSRSWVQFDPTRYVREKLQMMRQRSQERELKLRCQIYRPPGPQSMRQRSRSAPRQPPAMSGQRTAAVQRIVAGQRPGVGAPVRTGIGGGALRTTSGAPRAPPPHSRLVGHLTNSADGMRQLETRLKNLQRVLANNSNSSR